MGLLEQWAFNGNDDIPETITINSDDAQALKEYIRYLQKKLGSTQPQGYGIPSLEQFRYSVVFTSRDGVDMSQQDYENMLIEQEGVG